MLKNEIINEGKMATEELAAYSRGRSVRRVIVDECVSKESRLLQRFRQRWAGQEPMEYVFLAQQHRAIPDQLLLEQVLGPSTILLTVDRVLHNSARRLGLRSYTLNEQGELTRRPFPNVALPEAANLTVASELRSDYAHPANALATAIKAGLTERDFKRYRTRRRRIRSYFGSESELAKVSLTVGGSHTGKGLICGFFLAIAGHSGKKGIRASEGYGVAAGDTAEEIAWCVLHALREMYLLQLERVPTDLFVIPEQACTLVGSLLAGASGQAELPTNQALRTLLQGMAKVEVHPCVKGPFYDAMRAKLQQMAHGRSNELVTVDFQRMINACSRCASGYDSRDSVSRHEQPAT